MRWHLSLYKEKKKKCNGLFYPTICGPFYPTLNGPYYPTLKWPFSPDPNTATYAEIKAYIEKKFGYKVSSLYIGQIKDKAGIKERKNYNTGSGKSKVPSCPPEKEEAIMDAFRHFNLI